MGGTAELGELLQPDAEISRTGTKLSKELGGIGLGMRRDHVHLRSRRIWFKSGKAALEPVHRGGSLHSCAAVEIAARLRRGTAVSHMSQMSYLSQTRRNLGIGIQGVRIGRPRPASVPLSRRLVSGTVGQFMPVVPLPEGGAAVGTPLTC